MKEKKITTQEARDRVSYWLTPGNAPRMAEGWAVMINYLSDGHWHSAREIRDYVAEHSSLKSTTAGHLLTHGHHAGYIERMKTRYKYRLPVGE